MTIRDYISQKLSSFSIKLREADFVDITLSFQLDPTSEVTADNKRVVDIAYISFIPTILARPDVGEGSLSISYDRGALTEFYNSMCVQLDIPNNLVRKPKIRFM